MKRAALVLATVLAVPAWVGAQTPVDQKRPAAPDGTVSIENMAGTIKVTGWDRAEVQVKGTIGAGGELSFEGTGKSTHIEIEADHNPMGIKSDLDIYVPAASTVEIEGFQATITAIGVTGSVKAETVNGSITQSGAAKNVELQSVNGDVDVTKANGRVKAESVNGSVVLHDASGELEASTVHGKLHVLGGSWQRAEMESVAGTVRFEAAIAPRATVSIETVSGAVQLFLPANVGAEFAVSSFSGQINNELGPAAQKSSKWTPQTELNFTTGAGGARVTVETLSGAIEIHKRP
ncbi:MAG: DUF4097 family beta strand repeat-containing protein [Burkholderiales bacterium]